MEAIGEQLAEFGSTAGTLPRVGPRGRRPFDTHNVGRRPGRLSHLPARPAPTDPPIADAPKVGTPGAGTPNPDQGPADHSDSGAAETGPAETGAAGTDPVTLPAEDPLGLASLGELLAAATAAAPDALASADNAEAAHYAARVEELSRCVESLQIQSAGAVDRTRTQAITAAATTRTSRASPARRQRTLRDGAGSLAGTRTASRH